jgi:hypothetical protein
MTRSALETLVLVTVNKYGDKVQFSATGHCVLKFDNRRMFGKEFLELQRDEVRTLTYLEEAEMSYSVFVPQPVMMTASRPTGPIVTP